MEYLALWQNGSSTGLILTLKFVLSGTKTLTKLFLLPIRLLKSLPEKMNLRAVLYVLAMGYNVRIYLLSCRKSQAAMILLSQRSF